jgi:hypothetical protein
MTFTFWLAQNDDPLPTQTPSNMEIVSLGLDLRPLHDLREGEVGNGLKLCPDIGRRQPVAIKSKLINSLSSNNVPIDFIIIR